MFTNVVLKTIIYIIANYVSTDINYIFKIITYNNIFRYSEI